MFDFKKIFTGKSSSPEQPVNDHGGDYAVKKSKRTDVIARVLAILAAFLLWAYVTTTNSTTEERSFSLVPVTYREESILKNEYGLIVQSINIDTLNVKLEGLKSDVRAINASDVKAYVSLGSITEAGEYTLDVYIDVPSGTTCVAQSVDKVVVSVDKPDTRKLPLSDEKVVLSGWSLEKDCFFGEITLNEKEIILEGPTLELEKVADVEVRTDVIGSASDSFTATASVHLIDTEGNEIVGSGVSVRGGNHLEVSVEVLKKVKVDLKLKGKYGQLSNDLVTITPAQVWLTGEPEALEGMKELSIGSIDETTLTEDSEQSFLLTFDGVKITNEAGEQISSATAVIRVSALPVRTFANLPVLRNGAVVGSVTIDVRAVSADDAEKLQLLTADRITVNASSADSSVELNELTVSFDEAYEDAVYAIALRGYREAD